MTDDELTNKVIQKLIENREPKTDKDKLKPVTGKKSIVPDPEREAKILDLMAVDQDITREEAEAVNDEFWWQDLEDAANEN